VVRVTLRGVHKMVEAVVVVVMELLMERQQQSKVSDMTAVVLLARLAVVAAELRVKLDTQIATPAKMLELAVTVQRTVSLGLL
jgi:hypothetical protein